MPCLYVGPSPSDEEDFDLLRSRGITAILSLQTVEDCGERGMQWKQAGAESAGLCFRNVSTTDFDPPDLCRRLPACVTELKHLLGGGHAVYLHCTAGVTRSPTVAAAYLHWCRDWPLEKALARVQEARNCCPLADVIRRASRP